MRGGHRARVEAFPACGSPAGKFGTVIARHAITDVASAVAGLCENGYRKQHQNRQTTHRGHGPLHVDDIAAVDFMPQYDWRHTDLLARQVEALNIQISHIQRIFDDEIAPGLDHFAHQFGEDIIGQIGLFDLHTQQ